MTATEELHPDPLKQRRCPVCDQIFDLLRERSRGKKPIYCTIRCRNLGTKDRYCPQCDKSFTLRDDDPASTTFCSEECAELNRRETRRARVEPHSRTCRTPGCANQTATVSLNKVNPDSRFLPDFCSKECLEDWYEIQKQIHPGTWDICGQGTCTNSKIFQDHLLRKPQKYCSQECRLAHELERTAKRAATGHINTNIPAKLTVVKDWMLRGFAWYNHILSIEPSGRLPGRNEFPFEEESPQNQELILKDGWTPETYATVDGYISPALWRKIWGVPDPDDPPMDHIEIVNIPARWMKKIQDFRAANNQPPLRTIDDAEYI